MITLRMTLHPNFCRFIAGALLLAGMIFSTAQASEECKGRPALFDAEKFSEDASRFGIMGAMKKTPIAFAPSGDPCLGPVPIFAADIFHLGAPERDTHAMARRLAPLLAEYSARTHMEACARMCRVPDGSIVARIVTIHAHVACLAPDNTCPMGSVPTKETIHSHPTQSAFVANAVDALGWGERDIEGMAQFSGNPDTLSPQDRAAAPVWMVGSRGQLVYLDHPDGQEVERP